MAQRVLWVIDTSGTLLVTLVEPIDGSQGYLLGCVLNQALIYFTAW